MPSDKTVTSPGWQTMDSAPVDGTLILYRYDGHAAGECYWDGTEWYDNEADQPAHPTHWTPIPRMPI